MQVHIVGKPKRHTRKHTHIYTDVGINTHIEIETLHGFIVQPTLLNMYIIALVV